MINIIETTDYDIVATRRVNRVGEPRIKSFCARLFYFFFNKISKIDLVDGAGDYRLISRSVVDYILERI